PVLGQPDVEGEARVVALEGGAPGVVLAALARPAVLLEECLDVGGADGHGAYCTLSAMSVIAGVVQMTSGGDVAKNLSRAAELIGEAAARGAKLVVLPENFAILGEHERDKFAVAETIPGRIVGAMAEAAKKHAVALVLGGMP